MTAAIKAKILPILIQRKMNAEDELLFDYNIEKSILDINKLDNDKKNVNVIESLKHLIEIV